MGARQNYLNALVMQNWEVYKHPKPTTNEIFDSQYFKYISKVYSNLKGALNEVPIRHGPWDISSKNFIIELDEERHFNRYRALTLKSSFYLKADNFSKDNYFKYCIEKELICLRTASWGGNWKNNSTERQFEKSNSFGDLAEGGSSRWKQRAFYDFVKDISSKIMGIPIYRISIYDSYKGNSFQNLLAAKKEKLILEYLTTILNHKKVS